jgi:hypothetical protein
MKTVLARLGRFCLVVYMWKFMILLYTAYGYNVLCLQYLTVDCAVNALLFINGFSWRHPFVWLWPLSLSIFIPIPGSVYIEKFSSRLFQARSQQPDQPTCSYKRREITSIKYRFRPINSKNIEELKYWNYCLLITVPSKFLDSHHYTFKMAKRREVSVYFILWSVTNRNKHSSPWRTMTEHLNWMRSSFKM